MTSTQENINKYNEILPGLKEKLAAAVLLLAMTAAMLVTSTFAWVTLSYKPQVANVHTSVASNGNLEIALANGEIVDAKEPGKSQAGDGSLETVLRNVTWGNLINLNDPAYGLKHLVLRPSFLNDANLVERPLYGPVYDSTGRVEGMNTNFGYSHWDSLSSRFTATNKLGVRAITSMTYGTSGEQNYYNNLLNNVEAANARFQSAYHALAHNEGYMDALASMMTGYMVQNILKVNSSVGGMIGDATLKESDLVQFAEMYKTLISCFEDQAVVYAGLLNLQAQINGKSGLSITDSELLALEYNKSDKTAYKALINKGFTTYAENDKTVGIIKDMDNFLYDYNILKTDLIRINGLIDSINTSISWPKSPKMDDGSTRIIDDIINNLANVGDCTITGGEYTNLKIRNVGATAALALKDAGVCETKITNGILYNMDNRSGSRIRNRDRQPLTLAVKVMGQTYAIQSNVSTTATNNYFENERALIAQTIIEKFGAPERIAEDSYGFAVDFWVRTNAANSFLTLQGNVLTRTDEVDVKGKNAEGEEVQLYTITVKVNNTGEEGGTGGSILDNMMATSYDVYESTYLPEGANTEQKCWRFADSHSVVTTESLGGQEIPTPHKKVTQVETVIGYEGDNRIWEGEQHSHLSVSSATQGSGSCYVFYADSPLEQERSLNILKSMKVAFVDGKGELLTTAQMDTERHYSSAGKVIVPLVLNYTSINIGEDIYGNPQYAITSLEQNVAKRITAIVYLDGANLTNDDVLAAADIQGQMNIQFGSSVALVPLNNEKLYNSEISAQVESIEPNRFDYDTLADGEKMTSTVKVKITGTQPKSMTARFIRRINNTQGSLEESFVLTDANGDGIWEGNYTFLYPGDYILRSVVMDGVERDLNIPEGEDFPSVEVTGFTIKRVIYNMSEFVMSDEDNYSGDVYLQFAANTPDKMPKSVIGTFVHKNGSAVNVNFSYNITDSTWRGTANFASSGEYTMQYVVLDGQYVELPISMQKSVNLTLGMRVNVETTSPTTIFYGEDDAPEALSMQVEILDNNNDIVKNLGGVRLVYKMTETETLNSLLRYNSGAGYYEGEFPVSSGTWKFDHVQIQIGDSLTNNLYKVNANAPVFTVVPPTPPSFVETVAVTSQYVENDDDSAFFTATLKESGSAKVYAKLENQDGEVLYSLGSLAFNISNEFNYIFDINETGLWTVKSISVFDAFDSKQKYHALPSEITDTTYETGIVFDANNSTFVEKEIAVLYHKDLEVSYKFVNVANSGAQASENNVVFGKDSHGAVNGTFMQSHTLKAGAIEVSISDEAALIKNGYFVVEQPSLGYKYGSLVDANGKAYGGYSGGDEYKSGKTFTTLAFASADANDKTRFVLKNDVSFQYAAQYVPEALNCTIKSKYDANLNQVLSVAGNNPYKIEVYSIPPSAKITGITPTGSNATKVTYTLKNEGGGQKPTFTATGNQTSQITDSYTATVYAKPTIDNSMQRHASFELPSLTLTVYGVDSNCDVSLTLPGSDTDAIVFSRKGNGAITKNLGKVSQLRKWNTYFILTHTLNGYYGHGNQTITQMTVVKNNQTYTVTLENPLKINNPSSVNQ